LSGGSIARRRLCQQGFHGLGQRREAQIAQFTGCPAAGSRTGLPIRSGPNHSKTGEIGLR
jgi:hypothetical protein